MPIETFSNFTTKALPLTGDYLVGFDSTAEIKTTISSLIQTILPYVTSGILPSLSAINSVPVGTIITHAANVAPFGYLPCDGRLLSTVTYANLYSVIGTTYGSSPGFFNVPDLRGYFVRGWDNGAGIDIIDGTYTQSARTVTITTNTPHGLTTGNVVTVQFTTGTGVNGTFAVSVIDSFNFSYTALASQTASGTVTLPGLSHPFGQKESDALQGHIHQLTTGHGGSVQAGSSGVGLTDLTGGQPITGDPLNDGGNGIPRIATETRPKNIALLYCIKY